MRKLLLLYTSAAVLLGAPALGRDAQDTAAPSPANRTAGIEIQAFVRQALEDRLEAGNLPDGNLLRNSTRVALREEMPAAGMKLGSEALPRRKEYEFYLISTAAAQSEADKIGKPVYFIIVDQASVGEDTATALLGVDLVLPRDSTMTKLCCCRGVAQFRRIAGRWTFVTWANRVCS